MKTLKVIMIGLVVMLLGACATTTKMTASWKSPEYQPKNYEKIAVISITKDLQAKKAYEYYMKRDLSEIGLNIVEGVTLFSPKYFSEKPTEKKIEKDLKSHGVDGVLTVSVLSVDKEQSYVPGAGVGFYPGYYRAPFYSYYYGMGRIYDPGYYTTTTKVFMECNFYDLETEELVWTAQSKVVDPSSIDDSAKSFVKALVRQIQEDNVFGR
ncbi:hypothetical protein [Aureibacter tunicatorum]|uniref:DUF4136 domain-containing protein n=1 Tax=Aureibacter tunicatorum TaxID=866807 RepID=A0AAE3XTM1_9BACT|nr:hypothetical protein [Aureibacter tunicatorum]MDR6241853.1 hypothetical protein [Aureibacter tunicatorum]BDD07100.1 hypothetical protein AUTU_45830 [Aureibacter tunicatorum]